MPPEAYASRLVDYKVDLANKIGATMSSWRFELSAFAKDSDYPVIDKELHLIMMIYNLTSKVEFLSNHIQQLEANLERFIDDGK